MGQKWNWRTVSAPPLASMFVWFLTPVPAGAGAFLLTENILNQSVDSITHAFGYTGSGGQLAISVCVDPESQHATVMETPLQNAVDTWNSLEPTLGNYVDPSTEVPAGVHDFESVVLHELGHCAGGLGHPNLYQVLAEESITLAIVFGDNTISRPGPNGEWDFSIGLDGKYGSSDDLRGDDVNLHWYRIDFNDPFFVDPPPPPPVHFSTYRRDLAELPDGHTYAANANPKLSLHPPLGYPHTRAVMYDRAFPQTEFRSLGSDDVSTLKYGMSGLDEFAGNDDDYTIVLSKTAHPCDIPVAFSTDLPAVTPGRCAGGLLPIPGSSDHYRPVSEAVLINALFDWYFGPGPNARIRKTDNLEDPVDPGGTIIYTVELKNIGTDDLTGVTTTDTVPAGTTFDANNSDPGWSCQDIVAGSTCTIVGELTVGEVAELAFAVTVDDPLPPGVCEIVNTATVTDDGASGADIDLSDNSVTEVTPTNTSCLIFMDGFESGDTSAWSNTVP